MSQVQEQPTISEGLHGAKRYHHPGYGQISISRVSGRTNLYGSDFMHNNTVCIRIHSSTVERSLSRDSHFADKQFMEVEMSAAQWAEFVSSFNVGGGVCCSIRWNHGPVPSFPFRDSSNFYKEEMADLGKEGKEEIANLVKKISALKISISAKDDLLAAVERVHRTVGSSAQFVASSFGKYMETRTEKAKVEINAYMETQILRAGLANIAGTPLNLIEGTTSETEK